MARNLRVQIVYGGSFALNVQNLSTAVIAEH